MVSLAQVWLPVLLSAVFVFFASAMLNMLLRFWHAPDYQGFSNEDEVGAAVRKGNATAGMYMIPYCKPESMKLPETQEKFKLGPVGLVFLRQPGAMSMGASLAQWFLFCVAVSILSGCLAAQVLAAGTPYWQVFHVVGIAAFMGFALGSVPNAIWWSHPWGSTIKHVIDGLIYALITAATFGWLWPK
jgi:hypothetical protein